MESLSKLVFTIPTFVATLFRAKTDLCVKLVEKHQFVAVIQLERFQLGENTILCLYVHFWVSACATGTIQGQRCYGRGAVGRMEGEQVKDIPGRGYAGGGGGGGA